MLYLKIPLNETRLPWYNFRISLSGTRYALRARYNTRMDRWALDIMDAAQNPILMGVILLVDRALTAQYVTLSLPPGPLFVKDTSGQGRQPGLPDFYTDHMLVYGDPTANA